MDVLITGNTYPVKEQIKALGGRWDREARGWYVPEAAGPRSRDRGRSRPWRGLRPWSPAHPRPVRLERDHVFIRTHDLRDPMGLSRARFRAFKCRQGIHRWYVVVWGVWVGWHACADCRKVSRDGR